MADSYKLAGGLVLFVIFISSALVMSEQIAPDLAPSGGAPDLQAIQKASSQPVFTIAKCGPNDWSCGLVNFFANIGNGLVTGAVIGSALGAAFVGLLTFQLPAFQQLGAFGFLLNAMIVFPIIIVSGLFLYRLIKGLIPTIGGDLD